MVFRTPYGKKLPFTNQKKCFVWSTGKSTDFIARSDAGTSRLT